MQGRCSCQGTGEPKHTEMFLRGLDCIRKEMGEVLTDSNPQIFASCFARLLWPDHILSPSEQGTQSLQGIKGSGKRGRGMC